MIVRVNCHRDQSFSNSSDNPSVYGLFNIDDASWNEELQDILTNPRHNRHIWFLTVETVTTDIWKDHKGA